MKKLLSTVLLALVALAGLAQNVNTWNEVIVGYSNVRPLTVTSVTLYEDRTEVSMFLDFRAGNWISIAKETYLQAGDQKYPVKDATVIKLGERQIAWKDVSRVQLWPEKCMVLFYAPAWWLRTDLQPCADRH